MVITVVLLTTSTTERPGQEFFQSPAVKFGRLPDVDGQKMHLTFAVWYIDSCCFCCFRVYSGIQVHHWLKCYLVQTLPFRPTQMYVDGGLLLFCFLRILFLKTSECAFLISVERVTQDDRC